MAKQGKEGQSPVRLPSEADVQKLLAFATSHRKEGYVPPDAWEEQFRRHLTEAALAYRDARVIRGQGAVKRWLGYAGQLMTVANLLDQEITFPENDAVGLSGQDEESLGQAAVSPAQDRFIPPDLPAFLVRRIPEIRGHIHEAVEQLNKAAAILQKLAENPNDPGAFFDGLEIDFDEVVVEAIDGGLTDGQDNAPQVKRKISRRGRPEDDGSLSILVIELYPAWKLATGREPTSKILRKDQQRSGVFAEFLKQVLIAIQPGGRWSQKRLVDAVAKNWTVVRPILHGEAALPPHLKK